MKFYFVHENGEVSRAEGHSNTDFCNTLVLLTEREPSHSGLIGVIDKNGKLRATLGVNQYRGKFRNAVFDFVRKYRALAVLEQLAEDLRKQS